jgi:DNA-binding GntR family transcriptional regulator
MPTSRNTQRSVAGGAGTVEPEPGDGHGSPSGELSSAKGREAYEVLQRGIQSGRYPAGSRLKEVELADDLGMSRTPIREAIRRLERDGVVEIIPNRGAAVRSWTAEEVDDAYALRAVLEGFSASRAAVRIDQAGLDNLEQINNELERRVRESPEDTGPLIRLNAAFHEAITKASQNNRIADVLPQATEAPIAMKQAFWQSARAREFAVVYHREIVEALRAHDAVRAEAVMRSHVFAVKDFFTEHQRHERLRTLVDGSPDGA